MKKNILLVVVALLSTVAFADKPSVTSVNVCGTSMTLDWTQDHRVPGAWGAFLKKNNKQLLTQSGKKIGIGYNVNIYIYGISCSDKYMVGTGDNEVETLYKNTCNTDISMAVDTFQQSADDKINCNSIS
ncbi:MAG TPA: hypothetical protein VKR58_03990 [Aquella sp.]|nr:hypothetical protein [Aquella sp.]